MSFMRQPPPLPLTLLRCEEIPTDQIAIQPEFPRQEETLGLLVVYLTESSVSELQYRGAWMPHYDSRVGGDDEL
jgi:hypothetical protein